MACEPCIRGHRSTKCTHANERLMVPVRKPGRPLSTCPHPPNRACGCGSVTAALPRKQKCGCGTNNAAEAPSPTQTDPVPNDAPVSPTRGAPGNFRIQKPPSTSKQTTRKQSFDPATLHRVDPRSMNVMGGYLGFNAVNASMGGNGIIPTVQPNGLPLNYVSNLPQALDGLAHPSYNGHLAYPANQQLFNQQPLSSVIPKEEPMTPQLTNGHIDVKVASPPLVTQTAIGGGSCCSQPVTTDHSRHTPSSSEGSIKDSSSVVQKSSCCSSEDTSPENSVIAAPLQQPIKAPPAIGLPVFQQPLGATQMYPAFLQQEQTVYTYPAPYGSFQQPLQPSQYPFAVSISSYGQPMTPGAVPVVHPAPFRTNGTSNGLGTSHVCTCGDACNCVGCPAHPYNNATQEYVRSAMNFMLAETGSYEPQSATFPSESASSSNTVKASCCGGSGGEVAPSPPAAQTPSDTASALSEEQTLSASDFFFVDYHGFSGECGGDTATCPCGDDCKCLGCSIHNQPPA